MEVSGQRRTRWTLEPEPGEAELVARMFRSIAGGMGLTRLARELNAEGYRTRGGARWSKVSIGKLLKKEAHTGTLVWNTGSFRKLGEPAEPVRIEDAWPAIVDRTLFDRAQAALHSRAPAVMHPRHVFGSFLLAGLVFCSGCGAAMTSHSAKSGQYHYYACSARTRGGDDGCTQPLTRREVLENAVIARSRDRLLSDDDLAELVELVNREAAAMSEENAGRIESLDREIGDVSRRLDRYYDSFERGELDPSEMSQRVSELKDRLATLQVNRARLAAPAAARGYSVEEVREQAARLKELLECIDADARKLAVRSLISRIELNGFSVNVRYHVPTKKNAAPEADAAVLSLVPSGGPLATNSRSSARQSIRRRPVIDDHCVQQPSVADSQALRRCVQTNVANRSIDRSTRVRVIGNCLGFLFGSFHRSWDRGPVGSGRDRRRGPRW